MNQELTSWTTKSWTSTIQIDRSIPLHLMPQRHTLGLSGRRTVRRSHALPQLRMGSIDPHSRPPEGSPTGRVREVKGSCCLDLTVPAPTRVSRGDFDDQIPVTLGEQRFDSSQEPLV